MKPWTNAWKRCRSGGTVLALALGVGASLAGCDLFTDEEPCTLIGCRSGLALTMEGTPAPVTLRVLLPDGAALVQECLPQACALGTFFEGVKATSVEISVTMNGHTETFTTPLTYEHFYPNGEGCGDPCLVTAVHLKLLEGHLVPA